MHTFFRSIVVALLSWEARRALARWKPRIILVSGSVGKTTTKDAIFHVLHKHKNMCKSQKSFNSEIGVPLTILGLPNAWRDPLQWVENIIRGFHAPSLIQNPPKIFVLEVGSDHPGDIAKLMKWLHPNVTVLTSLPEVPVHVENFSSPEELRREDAIAVTALEEGGVYIANADDPESMTLIQETRARGVRVVTYGFHKEAEVHGSKLSVRYAMSEGVEAPVGMEFVVSFGGEEYPVHISGVIGEHVCSAMLAAIAVGVAEGENLARLVGDTISFESPLGRMRVISGKVGSTIIDDSYNSSPIALAGALGTLRGLNAKRKIAMLGDMLELGSFSEAEHWKAGRLAGEFVDVLITVGPRARFLAEGAKSMGLPEGHIHPFSDAEEAGIFMKGMLESGDVILVKGSQGSGENMIRMERAVKILMTHTGDAGAVLVRQEQEWLDQYSTK